MKVKRVIIIDLGISGNGTEDLKKESEAGIGALTIKYQKVRSVPVHSLKIPASRAKSAHEKHGATPAYEILPAGGVTKISGFKEDDVGVYIYFHADTKGEPLQPASNKAIAAVITSLVKKQPGIRKVCLVGCCFAKEETVTKEGLKHNLATVCELCKVEGLLIAGWSVAVSTITEEHTSALPAAGEVALVNQYDYVDKHLLAKKKYRNEANIGRKARLKDPGTAVYKILQPFSDEDRRIFKVIVRWKQGKVEKLNLESWRDK